MQPLPKDRYAERTNGRNAGLIFNKFVDEWPAEALNGIGDRKKDWLEKFSGPGVNTAKYAKRIKNLVENTQGAVENFTTTGPFTTGMGLPHGVENGFLWHHTLGCPYLPASSIKGMVRAWVEHWQGDSTRAGELFGRDSTDNPTVGRVIIHDAIPTKTVELYTEIITPHAGDWRLNGQTPPSDWLSPTPIPFLAVKEGAEFQFAISPRSNAEKDDLKDAFEYLKEALEWIGAGAKTAIGFGRFKSDSEKQDEESAWRIGLQVGDTANFYRQHVVIVDLKDGKAQVKNIKKDRGLGWKELSKLKPWTGVT